MICKNVYSAVPGRLLDIAWDLWTAVWESQDWGVLLFARPDAL